MTKDCRIVVRMSEDLRDWVHAQASAREMDDAAYVRMLLAEARSGVAASRLKAETPLIVAPPQPVKRDVLDVSSTGDVPLQLPEAISQPANDGLVIDIDAMVEETLAVAEEQGLTQPQIEAAQGEMPASGVRAVMRRPIPYSRGTQGGHLEQFFGHS